MLLMALPIQLLEFIFRICALQHSDENLRNDHGAHPAPQVLDPLLFIRVLRIHLRYHQFEFFPRHDVALGPRQQRSLFAGQAYFFNRFLPPIFKPTQSSALAPNSLADDAQSG